MATKFIEPGGDATLNTETTSNGGMWKAVDARAVATDIVHGSHISSLSFLNSTRSLTSTAAFADSGSRVSFYVYFVALPTNAVQSFFAALTLNLGAIVFTVRLTSAGRLQLWNAETAQIGLSGSTLSTGRWYRISLAYTITSTTINEFRLFLDGVQDISVSNGTLATTNSAEFVISNGVTGSDVTLNYRTSDHYVDNSSSLTDTGDVWVTAKRPFSNGTTNGFTTQIGSGGSGYGTGHTPQVNERPLSTTNGWSMLGAGAAITEEYSIEGRAIGDINLTGATIVDFVGWVYASSLLSETAQIVVANVNSNISLTSTNTMFTKVAGSTTYPVGGTDIGIITSTTLTTVSLFESGIMVAYNPPVPRNGFDIALIKP